MTIVANDLAQRLRVLLNITPSSSDSFLQLNDAAYDLLKEAARALKAQDDEIERLRETLEPFAAAAVDSDSDLWRHHAYKRISADHLCAAKEAYTRLLSFEQPLSQAIERTLTAHRKGLCPAPRVRHLKRGSCYTVEHVNLPLDLASDAEDETVEEGAVLDLVTSPHSLLAYAIPRQGGAQTAELQSSTPLTDGTPLVIYISEEGRRWARPTLEFYDGRFEWMPYAESADPEKA